MSNSCVVTTAVYLKFTHPRGRAVWQGPRGQEVAPLESKEPTSCLLRVAFARWRGGGRRPPTSPSTATIEEVDAVDAIPKHLQQLDT